MTTALPIRISEIFGPTIQGEGPLAGKVSFFVRTGGCDFRCSWCDTLFAVETDFKDDWAPRTAEQVLEKLVALAGGNPGLVTLSGGNPAIQPLAPLIALGRAQGWRFALETQGSLAKPWFKDLDHLILSPKGPSAGVETDWTTVAECRDAAGPNTEVALKFVVADEADWAFARVGAQRFEDLPIYLQPCKPAPGTEAWSLAALMERVAAERWDDATVLPQLHVLAWGEKRGV